MYKQECDYMLLDIYIYVAFWIRRIYQIRIYEQRSKVFQEIPKVSWFMTILWLSIDDNSDVCINIVGGINC